MVGPTMLRSGATLPMAVRANLSKSKGIPNALVGLLAQKMGRGGN